MKILLLPMSILMLAAPLFAETVRLKDGTVLFGSILQETGEGFTLATNGGKTVLDKRQVQSVDSRTAVMCEITLPDGRVVRGKAASFTPSGIWILEDGKETFHYRNEIRSVLYRIEGEVTVKTGDASSSVSSSASPAHSLASDSSASVSSAASESNRSTGMAADSYALLRFELRLAKKEYLDTNRIKIMAEFGSRLPYAEKTRLAEAYRSSGWFLYSMANFIPSLGSWLQGDTVGAAITDIFMGTGVLAILAGNILTRPGESPLSPGTILTAFGWNCAVLGYLFNFSMPKFAEDYRNEMLRQALGGYAFSGTPGIIETRGFSFALPVYTLRF